MTIVHQLPGRLRIRLPEVEDSEFSRKLTALFSQDERIADLWVTPACNSLTLYYDPLRITVPEIMASLQMARDRAIHGEETKPPGSNQPEGGPAGGPALTMNETEIREVAPGREAGHAAEWESPEAAAPVAPPEKKTRKKSAKVGDKTGGPSQRPKKSNKMP